MNARMANPCVHCGSPIPPDAAVTTVRLVCANCEAGVRFAEVPDPPPITDEIRRRLEAEAREWSDAFRKKVREMERPHDPRDDEIRSLRAQLDGMAKERDEVRARVEADDRRIALLHAEQLVKSDARIATLEAALREARLPHWEDCLCLEEPEYGDCSCGATAHNARIDQALAAQDGRNLP